MRIVFMGTPDFSVPVLEALIAAGHDIVAVYCQPPRPAGRGKKDRPTAVQARAEKLSLKVRHPLNFKAKEDVQAFADLDADIAVVVAYGLILPQSLLDAPKYGCLNIHASLLPRWRGAAPIHRAIMAGDTQTGICIMQMAAGLDTGPVLHRIETDILPTDTTLKLHDRLAGIGADAIVKVLAALETFTPVPQPETGVTYASKISKDEAKIDWSLPAIEIDQKIRGLSPFPGAWCDFGGARLKLLDCEIAKGHGVAGEILDAELTIACGEGAIRLKKLQRAGKTAMDPANFLLGFELPVGAFLN